MPHYINTIPQSHKVQHLAHTSYSHLIDGPIAKGGSGGGGRGGSRGGGGSSGGGSSGGGSSGGGSTPRLPPIIFIPGSSGGHGGHGSSSNSTAPYDSSSSKNTGAIVGGVLGGIVAITFMFLFGWCFYKRRQAKKETVEDAEAQDKELGHALMGPDGVEPFTLYPPPPPFTPVDPFVTATTQPDYIAAKSPLEYYRQAPSSSENLVSAATITAPVSEKDAQGQTQLVSSQSSSATLHDVENGHDARLKPGDSPAGATVSSSSPRAEQEWFLTTQVTTSLDAIQKALVACQDAARLQDDVMGALTLAISSPNNDTLKGFVTLSGSFIVKGELTIKLPKLPVVKAAIHSQITTNISAAQSLLTASNASTTGGGASSSSASSVTGALGGGSTGETSPEEFHATATEGTEASKADDGHGSQQLPTIAQGLATATGIETGIGAGSLVAPATATTPAATAPSSTATTATAGSATPSIPAPQMNAHQVLHSYRPPGHVTQPYALEQLRDVQNHTAQAIFRLEDYRKWRGEATNVGDGATLDIKEITRALKTMLELLGRHIRASIEAMAQPGKEKLYPFRVCDPKIFSPALSEDFVIEFYIRDSQLVCAAYALQLSSGSGSGQSSSAANALTTYLQHALPGASSASMPSLPHAVVRSLSSASTTAAVSSGSSADHHHTSASSASVHNGQTGNGGGGGRGGHGTPRPASPIHHHNGTSGHPSHASHQSHLTQQHGQEPVVLPTSDKIGQTSKGGINKYRGKIATTLEDKVVQVQSPKLAEISARLIQAENFCRRLLHFLVLQDSVAASPY
ncbi:hypothetical protein KI688_002517 [Linnemannia hyalina]|uniref:Uncharacterized protein n=1 Tax=Linnemannia hyalina TaxID=64524 RepID=A0A9P7XQD9_9FUNG|nr:hypothetical protein KI688_002517 [Linnemannia hyalina]